MESTMIPLRGTLSLILSCIVCVTSESFKDVIFQLKDQSQLPYVFEGIPIELRCIVDISIYSSVSWNKDGIEILSFSDKKLVSENLPNFVTVNPVYSFSNRGFFSIVFTNLTIADHRGLYSCIAGKEIEGKDSDFFLLDVKERKPVCASQKGEKTQEFLVGETLSLFCHNPLYSPPKVVRWYKMGEEGALQTMRTEYDYTSVNNATFALDPSLNGSFFDCYASDDDESALTQSFYSCSFGPIAIFDSSYVTIDETSSGANRTFSCRIVPQTNGASIRWTELPTIETFYISSSDYHSNVTFVDLTDSFDVGAYLSVACKVSTPNGKNFSTSKYFSVTSPTQSGERPSGDEEDFPILLVVIAAGVVVAFIVVIAIFILIFCAIESSRHRSKPSKPTGNVTSNDYGISFRKDSTKSNELVRLPDGRLTLRPCISIPEDDIELEINERSPLSSQGVGDSIYDLPPPINDTDVPPASPIYANKEII